MVNIREYDATDYRTLCHWWDSRGLAVPPMDLLPTFGLISPNVAAGFLIVTDCNLGILEFYITNPESEKEERDSALDQITEALILYAKSVGITNIKADTQIRAIRERAERLGFEYIGEFSNLFLKVME